MKRTAMCRSLPFVAILVLIATAAPAGDLPNYDPFRIPKEKLRAEVEKVVIRPFRLPSDIPDSEFEARLFDHHIANRLEKIGFEIVDGAEFENRWLEYAERIGGVFDPKTGVADDEKYTLVSDYTMRDLAENLDVDAVVSPSHFLRVSNVGWKFGALRSSGAQLVWNGSVVPFKHGLRRWPQRVESAMLGINIRNVAGTEVFSVGCPISWATIYMDRAFEERPPAEIYTNDHIENAVKICLQDFAERSSPPPSE